MKPIPSPEEIAAAHLCLRRREGTDTAWQAWCSEFLASWLAQHTAAATTDALCDEVEDLQRKLAQRDEEIARLRAAERQSDQVKARAIVDACCAAVEGYYSGETKRALGRPLYAGEAIRTDPAVRRLLGEVTDAEG